MKITIKTIDTIKPHLPTPDEHKIYKLCLFDQLQSITYLPAVLFYPNNKGFPEPSHISCKLRKSLSETLTIFYPVAGRRKDHTFITCNDEGALYLEANVNNSMVKFLTPPKLEFLNKLLPCEPNKLHSDGESLPQVFVQVNTFTCGGIAIGTCNLHTLLDGCSGSLFLATWAAICRGGDAREELPQPDFCSASSFFPPENNLSFHDNVAQSNEESGVPKISTTRRFVFDAESIKILRDEAKDDDDDDESSKFPTRYEALAAFIWKHITLACMGESGDVTRPALAMHIVDMRRRMGETFSSNTIGNILWPVMVLCETIHEETDIKHLVGITREKFGKVSRELFLRVKNDPNYLGSHQCVDLPEGIETRNPIPFVFASWCGLNLGELDFGWGKPLLVGVRGGDQENVPNVVVIMETDGGMEAWVTMDIQHIAMLEKDVGFLKFALPNPNVSKSNN